MLLVVVIRKFGSLLLFPLVQWFIPIKVLETFYHNNILISNVQVCMCFFFQSDKEGHKKAVFILCSPVYGTTKVILRAIIQSSSFEYCVLITSAHARVHQFARYGVHQEGIDVMSAFYNLEEEMLEWMGNMVCKNIFALSVLCVGGFSKKIVCFLDVFSFVNPKK
jgi:hypothetical protein